VRSRGTYGSANLLDQLLESPLGSFLGSTGLEGGSTGVLGTDGDSGAGSPVEVLDDVGKGTSQLVSALHVLRAQADGLDVLAARDGHRGDSGLRSRGGCTGGGSSDPGGAVGGAVAVVPVREDVPLGSGLCGRLGLGATKVGEQLARLGVEGAGGRGCLLLLSSCLSGQGRSVGGGGSGRGIVGFQVIIGDVFDSDMVALSGMFLGQLLGG